MSFEAHTPAELHLRMAQGAGWMVLLRFLSTAIGFVSTIILARLLVPADFGLIAMGTSLAAALDMLTTFRFDLALIQNQTAGRSHYDTAWTLNIGLGTTLALLLLLLAWPAASFYNEPRLENVVYMLALVALIEGLQNIGVVDFQKRLDFRRDFALMLIKRLAGFAATVPLAIMLRSYWALVLGILASRIAGTLASFLMHPYRPRFSLATTGELMRFSRWMLLDNLIFVLRHRSADFIIGKLAGGRQLGVFAMSYEIASLVGANLSAPINRAALPGYAQMATDPAVLRAGYLSVTGLIALIALPAAAGIGATAPLFVPVLLGAQWLDTIAPIQILAVASVISLMVAGAGPAFIAAGKPRLLVAVGGAHVLTLVPALLLLTPRHGPVGAAWSFLIAATVNMPVQIWLARYALQVGMAAWLARLWRPLAGAVLVYFVVRGLATGMPPAGELVGQLAQLLVAVLTGAVSYLAALLALWHMAGRPEGAERAVLKRLPFARDAV